jgi:hypothetical protein
MNIPRPRIRQAATRLSLPRPYGSLTRRQFVKAGAGAAALAASCSLGRPRPVAAQSPADPRPIPYGTPFLFPDPTLFHVQAPGYPLPNPPFDTNPATNDPSTITDFNGSAGVIYIGGQGTHHDLVTNQTTSLYWEVDMRFMVGEYLGMDGQRRHGTFGLI